MRRYPFPFFENFLKKSLFDVGLLQMQVPDPPPYVMLDPPEDYGISGKSRMDERKGVL